MINPLHDLVSMHPTYGFRKLFTNIRRWGKSWNYKKIYRVYKLLKLNKNRKGKRILPAQPLESETADKRVWSIDFMSYGIVGSRKPER